MIYDLENGWQYKYGDELTILNKLMDDDYINNLITAKLKFIRLAKIAFDEAVEYFNFDTVIKFMQSVNWCWVFTKNGHNVPDSEDIINMLHNMFDNAIRSMLTQNETEYHCETGGLIFELTCDDLNNPCTDNIYCRIIFDISTWELIKNISKY